MIYCGIVLIVKAECLTVLFPLFLTVHLSVTISFARAVMFRAFSPNDTTSSVSDFAACGRIVESQNEELFILVKLP